MPARLPNELIERVVSRYPLPIADAVGALAAADGLFERRVAVDPNSLPEPGPGLERHEVDWLEYEHEERATVTTCLQCLEHLPDDVVVPFGRKLLLSADRVIVSVPGNAELEVTDLFTDQVVARLDSKSRNFPATLRRDFAARLYRLQPPKQE